MRNLITSAIFIAASLAAFAPASAQPRPSTTQLSCHAANALVQQRGAVVLGTGGETFDRFVRDASFCAHGQTLRQSFAPSADQSQCFVGWRCYDESLIPK